jgi:hypothetical protein
MLPIANALSEGLRERAVTKLSPIRFQAVRIFQKLRSQCLGKSEHGDFSPPSGAVRSLFGYVAQRNTPRYSSHLSPLTRLLMAKEVLLGLRPLAHVQNALRVLKGPRWG